MEPTAESQDQARVDPDAIYNQIISLGGQVSRELVGPTMHIGDLYFYPPVKAGNAWVIAINDGGDDEDTRIGKIRTPEDVSHAVRIFGG